MDNQTNKIQFFVTAPHRCNYLPGKEATSLFADPVYPKDKAFYSLLIENGFRRSGEHLYRNYCGQCSQCIPLRIPVNEFEPRRQHKRTLRQNRDLQVKPHPPEFNAAHFQLYRNYMAARHHGGGMDDPSEDSYCRFLWSGWSDTVLYEFYLERQLLAVTVVDRLERGNSAVYTFFDPARQRRSPGKQAILYLIELTRQQKLPHLYLGYWIAGCAKMKYKIDYQPAECFINGAWKTLPGPSAMVFSGSEN